MLNKPVNKKISKGFSLVELLVVVAIIGILSSIVLVSLGDARARGRLGRAQTQMSSLHSHLIICINEEKTLTSGTPTGGTTVLCPDSVIYPELPSNWSYGATVTTSSFYFRGRCLDYYLYRNRLYNFFVRFVSF